MEERPVSVIHIAAALIDDGEGRLLLVRKAGTEWYMQAGGKIEGDEDALTALRRELVEEIGLHQVGDQARYLGRFSAPAANEAGQIVEAEVFHIRVQHVPKVESEIEEAIWTDHVSAMTLPLAPLTRDHILPLALTLGTRSGGLAA